MPIQNEIDDKQRCIYTNCVGSMTSDCFDDYLARIWTKLEYFGYNELFDTTQADWSDFNFGYLFEVAKRASELTALDPNSKMAWHVSEGKVKELTDFYITAKSMITSRSRSLEAFYDRNEALKWLGIVS